VLVGEWSVGEGEQWALVGQNGSGKSTLLRTLAGLLNPVAGTFAIAGEPPDHRRVGYLPQSPPVAPGYTVREAVELGAGFLGLPGHEVSERASAALANYDLLDLADRDCAELSGGEAQRMSWARLAAQNPTLWLLDEPTAQMDAHHANAVRRQLTGTAIMAVHDLDWAGSLPLRVALIIAGELVQCVGWEVAVTDGHLERALGAPCDLVEGRPRIQR
jgi:ABC-type cobalamin/Fe3+-siderophores transport system ATPase subunit